LTASVISNSGTNTPTGVLTLTANGVTLGTASLASNGAATFKVFLPIGAESIQVAYAGDTNYLGSTSNALALNVAALPDFSVAASAPGAAISHGNSTTANLTVTPEYGFNQPVTFTCFPSIAEVSCNFSPSSVTPGSGPATATVSLSLSGNTSSAKLRNMPLASRLGGIAMALILCLPLRKRRFRSYLTVGVLLIAGLAISACGSSTSTGKVIPVVISATSGSLTRTTSFELAVK
jgi:hypothetical protein